MILEFSTVIHTKREAKEIRYFVTEPTLPHDCTVPCYGIGISDGETAYSVAAFSPNKDETVHLAQRMMKMQVTPVTFFAILEDYLTERE
ncbi:MAG: hypothetical protein E7408_06110 [Ruminococcaceae bacterium]|nr:hypothetical protein [Oscillospiraceae bacterium]